MDISCLIIPAIIGLILLYHYFNIEPKIETKTDKNDENVINNKIVDIEPNIYKEQEQEQGKKVICEKYYDKVANKNIPYSYVDHHPARKWRRFDHLLY